MLICSNRADASDALNALAEAIKAEMQKRVKPDYEAELRDIANDEAKEEELTRRRSQ